MTVYIPNVRSRGKTVALTPPSAHAAPPGTRELDGSGGVGSVITASSQVAQALRRTFSRSARIAPTMAAKSGCTDANIFRQFRVNRVVRIADTRYSAFLTQPHDILYLPSNERAHI
jgi:hypothetical protein